MFMNNFEFKINDVKRDRNGNFIFISFSMKDTDILLVNVYGPNRDTPAFYEELTEMVKEYQNHNIIIVGDWNLVLDPQLDSYNYKHINNPKAKESVENMMLELGLTDIWREANPDCKRYTWIKTKPLKQSRLDYFLLSDYIVSSFEDTDILPGYRSDHSMVTLKLRFGKEMKRNTFWKFNCSLLKDKKYIDEINDEINNVTEQYAAPHYDKASISGIAKSDLELTVSDKVLLDFLLMKIRARTSSYATMKKKKTREKEDSLLRDIKLFEEKESKTETDIKHIAEKNKKLVSLRKKTMEGVLLRSKARWVAEGEKISKYFCNLEKRHYVSKQMIKLIDAKGEEIKEQLDINKEVNNFYSNLYKAKDLEECEIEQLVTEIPKLSEEESRSLEGKIT